MLCFLPPLAPMPRQPATPRPRPTLGPSGITAIAALVVGLSALTPIGWSRTEPEFPVTVGRALRIGPRHEERVLSAQLASTRATRRALTFAADRGADLSLPPGLRIEPLTGAVVGTPTLAGTYRVAIGITGGRVASARGPTFRIKVLPAP